MTNLSTLGLAGQTTSLFAPQEVDQLMRVEFERGQRYHYSVACMLIQVDRLEQIQTIHGWEAREEILKAVIETLRRETRDGDLLGYLVEDKMMVLFPHTSEKAAKVLADRMLDKARKQEFRGVGGTLRITLSIGISHNSNERDLSFDSLKEVACESVAVADASGGDRWAATELYSLVQRKRDAEEAALRAEADRLAPQSLVAEAHDPSYREILEGMVSRDGDLEKAVASLVEQIMARAVSEAKEDADAVASAGAIEETKEDAYQREISLLRRRVAKLTESLGLTESEIARLRKLKTVDDGVASIYRDVQGIEDADAQAEMKKALMQSIFQANIDLQKSMPQKDA